MSAMGELAERIEADKERVAELAAKVAATRQALETATGKAEQLGAEDIARSLRGVERELEEAESGRAVLEGSLEKARWQVMAAIHGIGPGAPKGDGGMLREHHPDGLDAVPPHVRFGAGPSGDELMGKDPNLSPFQKEHEGAEEDRGKSRAQRFSRKLVRNIEDIASASKTTAKSSYQSMSDGYQPPRNPQLYETVGTPDHVPTSVGPQPAPKTAVEDTVASMVVLAVVAVEGVARFVKARKGKDDDKLSAISRGHESRRVWRCQARRRTR